MYFLDSGNAITLLLAILCILASLDLWRQYSINNSDYWYFLYSDSVKSSNDFWALGYRIEDLELKSIYQQNHWNNIRHVISTLSHPLRGNKLNTESIRGVRNKLHNLLQNDSAVYEIRCEASGPLLRIGQNDFRTDVRDACQIFTGPTGTVTGPQTMFEAVPLGDNSFGLKTLTNGYFLRVVPPPVGQSTLPWKIVVGGPSPGLAERFYLTDEGYLYSSMLGGFFQCASDQMVKGFPGKYGTYNKFKMTPVITENVQIAREVVDLSSKIIAIQSKYILASQTTQKERNEAVKSITGIDNTASVKICIGVPMTSKGTLMKDIGDSPFWTNLFDSFMKTVDWRSNRMTFAFYLGFDKADSYYDTGDAWSELREEFKKRAASSMADQQVDNATIDFVLQRQLRIKLMHFDHLEGAPTQVVSQLMLQAYDDKFDYFYQVNDDTVLVTPNWAPGLIAALASNPSIPNFGAAGPVDTNNDKIFTHAFVHRTHIEVFGHFFPPSFKNWWSDDWISTVYGSEHTFRVTDVQIKHNIGSQKTKGPMRYEVDQGARLRLDDELRKGHIQVDQWLKKNKKPRLPLPNICGFAPLAAYLTDALRQEPVTSTSTTDTITTTTTSV